jgi:hypothetical protein
MHYRRSTGMLGVKECLQQIEPDELKSRISDRWSAAEVVEYLDLPIDKLLDLVLELVYTEPMEYEEFIRMVTYDEENDEGPVTSKTEALLYERPNS